MTPSPQPTPTRLAVVEHLRVRAWLQTRREMAELAASVVYLDLLLRLGLRALTQRA